MSGDQIKSFLKEKKVLIVDVSSPHRLSIAKVVLDLGAQSKNILHANSYAAATKQIEEEKPQIIFSEFQIENFFGIDLLTRQVQIYRSENDRLFILQTADASESAIAEAAEGSVDSFILKPFSANVLIEHLTETIKKKLQPSAYQSSIYNGRTLFESGSVEEAKKVFEEAKTQEAKHPMACYYLGQISEKMNDQEGALIHYDQALSQRPSHYKSLVGKFELLEKMRKKNEAYICIQELAKCYPISPDKLGRVFTLAVHTGNFSDVEYYFGLFLNLERRNSDLTKIVVGGLLINGKFLVTKKEFDAAAKVFTKAATTCSRNPQILGIIINIFLEVKKFEHAQIFLAMHSPDDMETANFKILEFLISNGFDPPGKVIEKGRRLIADGIANVAVYTIILDHLNAEGGGRSVETLFYQAMEKFPEQKEFFVKKLEEIMKKEKKIGA